MRRCLAPQLAAILFFLMCAVAGAESGKGCLGDLVKRVTDGPYDFVMTSRVQEFPEYKLVVTCIENKVDGYFRWRWNAPGHSASFAERGINESPRPVSRSEALNIVDGCYIYGNLNSTGRAFFHATQYSLFAVEREKNGCPSRFSALTNDGFPLVRAAQIVTRHHIPSRIKYEQEVTFFADGPIAGQNVIRMKLDISFELEGGRASSDLTYAVAHNSSADIKKLDLTLRPIEDGTEAAVLSTKFYEQVGIDYRLREHDALRILYGAYNARFGSSRMGIYSGNRRLLAEFWVPLLY